MDTKPLYRYLYGYFCYGRLNKISLVVFVSAFYILNYFKWMEVAKSDPERPKELVS